jgi:hypothetical protein
MVRWVVSSMLEHDMLCLAICTMFSAIHISACSSCSQPPCLASVADMLKTYKSVVMFESKGYVTAKTSIIYSSVASANAYTAPRIHPQHRLSQSISAISPEQTSSWCSISHTVLMNALVVHEGFPLRLCLNCSRSLYHILA